MVLDLRKKAEVRWGNSPAQPRLAKPHKAATEARLGARVRGKGWQRHICYYVITPRKAKEHWQLEKAAPN